MKIRIFNNKKFFTRYSNLYTALCGFVMFIFAVIQFIVSLHNNIEPSLFKSIWNYFCIFFIGSFLCYILCTVVAGLAFLLIFISMLFYKILKALLVKFADINKFKLILQTILILINILAMIYIVFAILNFAGSSILIRNPNDLNSGGFFVIASNLSYFIGIIVFLAVYVFIVLIENLFKFELNIPRISDTKLYKVLHSVFFSYFLLITISPLIYSLFMFTIIIISEPIGWIMQ